MPLSLALALDLEQLRLERLLTLCQPSGLVLRGNKLLMELCGFIVKGRGCLRLIDRLGPRTPWRTTVRGPDELPW